MKKIITLGVAAATCLFSFQSCKKKAKEPVCKIQQLTSTSGVALFSYDDAFRLSKITEGADEMTYSYSGNTTTIFGRSSGSFDFKTTLTLNDQEQIINARTENNSSGTDWENYAYTYSGTELTQQLKTSSSSGPSTITFTWMNGNLFSINGSPIPFTYDANKLFQDGDYLNISFLLQKGYNEIKNKNLVINVYGSPLVHTFDEKGKITRITYPDATYIDYTYTCR